MGSNRLRISLGLLLPFLSHPNVSSRALPPFYDHLHHRCWSSNCLFPCPPPSAGSPSPPLPSPPSSPLLSPPSFPLSSLLFSPPSFPLSSLLFSPPSFPFPCWTPPSR